MLKEWKKTSSQQSGNIPESRNYIVHRVLPGTPQQGRRAGKPYFLHHPTLLPFPVCLKNKSLNCWGWVGLAGLLRATRPFQD
jgi:hypothetical protein